MLPIPPGYGLGTQRVNVPILFLSESACDSGVMDDVPPDLPTDIGVPDGRSRLGRAHGFCVTIATTLSTAPSWLTRGLADKRAPERRRAHVELIERLATALERSFRITWRGSNDADENARPVESFGALFGSSQHRDGER